MALGLAAAASAAPAVAALPSAALALRVAPQPGPPNGDLALGLEGWQSVGRPAALVTGAAGRPSAVLRDNTGLVSSPFSVAADGQVLAIVARAPGGGGLLEVRARPEDGSPEVPLGTVVPGTAPGTFRIPLAGIGGRAVRLVLDPVTGLGRSVEVSRVGPVETVLPGWSLREGLPVVGTSAGRRAVLVTDAPLEVASLPFSAGAGARHLLVSVRGEGRLSAQAGGRTLVASGREGWRDVRVPLGASPSATSLVLRAQPEGDGLAISDLGLVVRQTALRGLTARRRGAQAVVGARVGPTPAGLVVEVRTGRRVLARARLASRGLVALRVPASGGRVRVVVVGDRTRIGVSRSLRLPRAVG